MFQRQQRLRESSLTVCNGYTKLVAGLFSAAAGELVLILLQVLCSNSKSP